MARSLRTLFWNGLYKLRTPNRPGMGALQQRPEDIDRAAYAGDCEKIFFENEGERIHKWMHYLPIYDRIFGPFRGTPVRFLEIGVYRGGSLKMWREFFGPDAVIFGIDIDPACAQYNGRHAQVRIGSQDDPAFLRSVVAEMGGVDVVLDDGSHVASHQRASFDALFPLLEQDGLYAIEDLHTAYWWEFEGGLRRNATAIEFLKDKIDDMHQHYVDGRRNTDAAIPPIESIQFFDSIAVITKRAQKARVHVMNPHPA